MHVLFVCTGNSCRSPMAEVYFSSLCSRPGCVAITVSSAGTAAWPGMPASRAAIATMAELGLELRSFRSTRLTTGLADSADLIVAMSDAHRRAVLALAPAAADKTRLLLGDADVPDPFGGSVADYRAVFSVMRPALTRLADELLAGA